MQRGGVANLSEVACGVVAGLKRERRFGCGGLRVDGILRSSERVIGDLADKALPIDERGGGARAAVLVVTRGL